MLEESTQESGSQEDVGRQILGTIAKEVFKGKGSSRETTSTRKEAREKGPASIRVATEITNAFLLKMSFSMHNEPGVEGAFEIALFQDERGDFGYTLAVDEAGLMDLYRLRRGQSELVNGSKLENNVGDGSVHDLVWRQASNGQVEVLMDEKKIMSLRDNAFREGYQWLELTNLYKRYVLKFHCSASPHAFLLRSIFFFTSPQVGVVRKEAPAQSSIF